jgi:hypothetical protein
MQLARPQQHSPEGIIQAINQAFDMIERRFSFPNYVTATKPAAASVPPGTVIYVSDGGAGAVFQGSTGAAWVNLG